MVDHEFHKALIEYISDFSLGDNHVPAIQIYINIQPVMVSFGGQSVFNENESIPLNLRCKTKSSNKAFTDQIRSFHKRSTQEGLNKWNRATINITKEGHVDGKFTWDDTWEQEEMDAAKGQTEAIREKWYWE
jgi:hypothetical protein